MTGLVVITGAAAGIGRAVAARLRETHTVLAVDRDPAVTDAASELGGTGVVADLTRPDAPDRVAAAVADAGLPLTGLVNNAGITRDARLVNMTDEQFAAVLQVNLGAAYLLSRDLAPLLVDGGAIVNIASRAYLGNFGQFNYSMSKGALVGLTRSMALELAPAARVNAIAPGLIATEMSMAIPEEVRERMVAAIPLGRMGEPAEVAELVAFLGSGRSSYLTGQVVVLGGGRSLT